MIRVELQPTRFSTHALTIPGSTFLAFVESEASAEKLAKELRKTKVGRRKAAPEIRTVDEWRTACGP